MEQTVQPCEEMVSPVPPRLVVAHKSSCCRYKGVSMSTSKTSPPVVERPVFVSGVELYFTMFRVMTTESIANRISNLHRDVLLITF
ncbi:hypothetical protein [Rubritalea tangerina]|uniref:hypothetical protein n=1 Tax=Rubritalea tangerina TaxID=430798 RepID=UPI003611EE05